MLTVISEMLESMSLVQKQFAKPSKTIRCLWLKTVHVNQAYCYLNCGITTCWVELANPPFLL